MEAYRDQYATLFHNGQDVVLLAISTDSARVQASWAMDANFPFTFVTDVDMAIGKAYGVAMPERNVNHRTVIVIAPDGKIAHVMSPFREVDATAYTALGEAIDRIAGKT